MSDDSQSETTARAEEFLQLFRKGAEFSRDLLKENERLRYRVLQLEEQQRSQNQQDELYKLIEGYKQKISQLEAERDTILAQAREVEDENVSFANRYVEIENENNMLANLYIASYQLHANLDFPDVVRTISEIIINLIGGEEFAVLMRDEKTGVLEAVSSEGIEGEKLDCVRWPSHNIEQALHENQVIVCEEEANLAGHLEAPRVIIPLQVNNTAVGVILIYSLLQQKQSFSSVDHELFKLLGAHAATALLASKLYSLSERKLTTIQGFIDLLTK